MTNSQKIKMFESIKRKMLFLTKEELAEIIALITVNLHEKIK